MPIWAVGRLPAGDVDAATLSIPKAQDKAPGRLQVHNSVSRESILSPPTSSNHHHHHHPLTMIRNRPGATAGVAVAALGAGYYYYYLQRTGGDLDAAAREMKSQSYIPQHAVPT